MTKGREQHPGARAYALRDEDIIIICGGDDSFSCWVQFVQDDEDIVQVVLSLQLGTGAYSALSKSCLPRHNTVGRTIVLAPQVL